MHNRLGGKFIAGNDIKLELRRAMDGKINAGYIEKVWTRFYSANVAPKFVAAPHVWTTPQYGSSQPQLTTPIDSSPLLSAPNKTRLQEIVGSLLYFPCCIDSTILATLGSIRTNISDGT